MVVAKRMVPARTAEQRPFPLTRRHRGFRGGGSRVGGQERRLGRAPDRKSRSGRIGSRELLGRQALRDLEQRERVPRGCVNDVRGDRAGKPRPVVAIEQGKRSSTVERAKLEHVDALARGILRSDDHGDRAVDDARRNELDRLA